MYVLPTHPLWFAGGHDSFRSIRNIRLDKKMIEGHDEYVNEYKKSLLEILEFLDLPSNVEASHLLEYISKIR